MLYINILFDRFKSNLINTSLSFVLISKLFFTCACRQCMIIEIPKSVYTEFKVLNEIKFDKYLAYKTKDLLS